jgi:hypothetical protein
MPHAGEGGARGALAGVLYALAGPKVWGGCMRRARTRGGHAAAAAQGPRGGTPLPTAAFDALDGQHTLVHARTLVGLRPICTRSQPRFPTPA